MGKPLHISLYHYNADECIYKENASLGECATIDKASHVTWINILGATDQASLKEVADIFKIHPLVVEDIIHTGQRAKIEDYSDFHFIVLRMFAIVNGKIEDQQVSFILRNNVLIAFHESDYGIFKPLGDKLISGTATARKKGEDYLLYKLLDIIIDNYYFVLSHIDGKLETVDQQINSRPDDHHIVQLQRLRSELLYMRKNILPARDLINTLMRNEVEFFDKDNKYYLRDMQDHMQRNVEELDFQREQVNSLMDFYYSLQTHKMNNVMKTLTIVSFVFLPLTFIASLYGMNFDVMPHIHDVNGFWQVLTGMGVIALVLITFAIRRQWISTKDFLRDK